MHSRSHGSLRVVAVLALPLLLALVLLGSGLSACGSESSAAAVAPETETSGAPAATPAGADASATPEGTAAAGFGQLTVSAASSLKNAFTEIGEAFDAATGSTTTLNFDASGTLQRQIEGGAPVDVFASAAQKQVNALRDENLVDASSIKQFAGNGIVLVVPANSTLGLGGFEDLTKPEVKKIGYGDPKAAPHGVAAEEILTSLGILDQVRSKVVYAANVTQALEYVTTGEVDAAIIFATEAQAGGDKVKVVAKADQSLYTKVAYPIALVSASETKDLGQRFIDFVMGSDGQAILAKWGFLPAPTS